MENYIQHPTKVPDHASAVHGELLVDVVLVKRGEDLVFKQAVITQTLFQKSPTSAASQIFSQIGTKFLSKEQIFVEQAICRHSGIVRTNNINKIYVYIVVTDTITEVDQEEIVTLCTPMIFLKKPCEGMNEQFKNFSGYMMNRIQEGGSKFKSRLRKVHEAIQKYGDSMLYEEVKEDSDTEQGCSICMTDYTVGSQAIRLPCDHLFCTKCILLWLIRNGSCPLCRYQLVVKSPALEQR